MRIRFLHFFLLAGIVLFSGCQLDEERLADDRVRAEAALTERDIGDAEMYFERYLRKNIKGGHRWEVWLQLLSISLDILQDKPTARDYLEIMLLEFTNDGSKRRFIQMRLAEICTDTRMYTRAFQLWEALAVDPDLDPKDRAGVYRELSYAYLRRLEFTAATDTLDLCLNLEVGIDSKADCLFALAETLMLMDELTKSEKAFRDLLLLPDLAQELKVLGTFMLADVLEQQQRRDEARGLFESIRETYPNPGVVEVRLTALKSKTVSK